MVGFPPTIELPRPRVPQAAYYEAHLECHIRAYPSTTINWKRNETLVENDGNHFISHYADSDELVISTMKVRKLHKYLVYHVKPAAFPTGISIRILQEFLNDSPLKVQLFPTAALTPSPLPARRGSVGVKNL